jgi:hypothetical protein
MGSTISLGTFLYAYTTLTNPDSKSLFEKLNLEHLHPNSEGNVTDLGGKVVAFRRQNRVRQLKDTWPIGFFVSTSVSSLLSQIEMTDEETGFLDLTTKV